MEREYIEIVVGLKDELSRPARRVEDSINDIGDSADDSKPKVERLDDSLGDLGVTAQNAAHHIEGAADSHTTYARNLNASTVATRRQESALKRTMRTFANYGRQIKSIGTNFFTSLQMYKVLFTDMGAAIPQLITGVYSLGAGLAALMGPLGRVAGVAGQAIPVFGAFGQSAAVLMLSMRGVGEAMKVLTNPELTAAQELEVYKALGPTVSKFVKSLLDMRRPLGQIREETQETFLRGMNKSVDRITRRTLPALRKGLVQTAREMNSGLGESIKQLTNKENTKNFKTLLGFGAEISGSMTQGLAPLLEIITKLGVAAGPAAARTMDRISKSLQRISDNIDLEDLTDWFMRSADSGSALWTATKNLFSGLGGVARAASGLSGAITESWMDRLQRFADWSNSEKGQASMAEFFDRMRPNIEAMGDVMSAIGTAIHDISGSPYFADFMKMLAADGIPALSDTIQSLDKTVNPALMNLGDALSGLDIEGVFKPLGVILDGLATAADLMVTAIDKLGGPGEQLVGMFIGLKAIGATGILADLATSAVKMGTGFAKGGLKGGLSNVFGTGGMGGATGTMNVTAGVVNVYGGGGLGPGGGVLTGAGGAGTSGGFLSGLKGSGKLAKGAKGLGAAAGLAFLANQLDNSAYRSDQENTVKGTSSALKGAAAGSVLGPAGMGLGLLAGATHEWGPGERSGNALRYKEQADRVFNPGKYATPQPSTPSLRGFKASATGSSLPFNQRTAQEQEAAWLKAKQAVSEFGTVVDKATGLKFNVALNDSDFAAMNNMFADLGWTVDSSKAKVSDLEHLLDTMTVAKDIKVTATTDDAESKIRGLVAFPWRTTVSVGYNAQGLPTTNGVVDFAALGKMGPKVKGARWAGGSVESGNYLVGELGPEMYVGDNGKHFEVGTNGPEVRNFARSGYIVPNSGLEGAKEALSGLAGAKGRNGGENAAEGHAALPPVSVNVYGNISSDVDMERAITKALRKAQANSERRR